MQGICNQIFFRCDSASRRKRIHEWVSNGYAILNPKVFFYQINLAFCLRSHSARCKVVWNWSRNGSTQKKLCLIRIFFPSLKYADLLSDAASTKRMSNDFRTFWPHQSIVISSIATVAITTILRFAFAIYCQIYYFVFCERCQTYYFVFFVKGAMKLCKNEANELLLIKIKSCFILTQLFVVPILV